MPSNNSHTFTNTLKALLQSLVKYYPVLAAVFTVAFTVICLIFDEFYLATFSIDFFSFGGITDAYQIAISNGVLQAAFWLSIIIAMGFQFVLLKLNNAKTTSDAKKIKGSFDSEDILNLKDKFGFIYQLLLYFVILMAYLFLIKFTLVDFPKSSASDIKNGFSERYNVLANDKKYLCHAIIGGTSQYLFLWNYEDKRPHILPRSNIKSLEQIIPTSPPWRAPVKRFGTSNERFEITMKKLKDKQQEWSLLLSKKCSQQVTWKEFH